MDWTKISGSNKNGIWPTPGNILKTDFGIISAIYFDDANGVNLSLSPEMIKVLIFIFIRFFLQSVSRSNFNPDIKALGCGIPSFNMVLSNFTTTFLIFGKPYS